MLKVAKKHEIEEEQLGVAGEWWQHDCWLTVQKL